MKIENDKEYVSKPRRKGLDKLTIDKLKQTISGIISRKPTGLHRINAELIKYSSALFLSLIHI